MWTFAAGLVSELRYGGRRLIEAIDKIYSDGPEDEINGLLQDAEFDCQRARHDAIDAGTATISVELSVVVRKIDYEIVLKTYPEFTKLVTKLKKIREKITESRKNRGSREKIYSELEENEFPDLVEAYRIFQTSEPIMKEMARRQRWRNLANLIFGVAGLIGVAITIVNALS